MRAWKDELLQHRKEEMEEKQKRAELKRELNLQAVRRKAQEEEAKVQTEVFSFTILENRIECFVRKHLHNKRKQKFNKILTTYYFWCGGLRPTST